MNTMLPMFYNFRSENVLTPNRVNLNLIDKMPKWIGIIAIIVVVIMAIVIFIEGGQHIDSLEKSVEFFAGFFAFALAITMGIGLYQETDHFTTLNDPVKQPYNLSCNSKLRSNSNLIARQVKQTHPLKASDQSNYPYRFYVKSQDGDNRLIYLGKIKESGQIVLSDTNNVNRLFASYYNYVQKHHLSDKFTQNLFFVKDSNVIDANGISQYVLKGDGITLKIKPDKNQKYQIYTVKE